MEQLPKIVQQRLRTSGKPAAHPDANVLAAFAERALSERERAQVLTHLADCAGCRETVSLAGSALEADAEAPARVPASRWLSWPVLRWGALAACAVVVGAAVTLHYEWRTERRFDVARPVSTAPDHSADVSAGSEESGPVNQKLAAKMPPPSPVQTYSDLPRASKLARSQADDAAVGPVAGWKEKQLEKAQIAVNKPPAALPGSNEVGRADALKAEPERSAVAGQLAAAPAPAPNSEAKPASPELQAREQDELTSRPSVSSETVTVQAEAIQAQTATASVRAKSKDEARRDSGKKVQTAAGAASGGVALGDRKLDSNTAELRSRQVLQEKNAAAKPSTLWSVSPSGALQRSLDAGRNWLTIPVASNVFFRALAVNDADVWAGGNAGSLYHSVDGGEHWTQVKPAARGKALTDDIVQVEFSDPLHGRLRTASRETWSTGDGGATWSME